MILRAGGSDEFSADDMSQNSPEPATAEQVNSEKVIFNSMALGSVIAAFLLTVDQSNPIYMDTITYIFTLLAMIPSITSIASALEGNTSEN